MAEKIIKNSARNSNSDTAENVEKYAPQYRLLGIQPEERNFAQVEGDQDNGSFGMGPINVGNNEELSWTQSFANIKDKKSDDLYLLLAKDKLIMTGSYEEIQRIVEQIFYQESGSKKLDFSIEDLTVLKKLKIKIGIFVE